MKTVMNMKLALVVMFTLMMGGCESLANLQGNSSAKLAVQYAVLKYTNGEAERAASVKEAVDSAIFLLEDDVSATVAALKAAVVASIDFSSLEAADQFLARGVIDAVALELAERVGDGELSGDKLLQVREVLTWVSDAAFVTASGGRVVHS